MKAPIEDTAAVVGCGIAGLAAAAALAPFFERVLVIERDALPEHAKPRRGTPQARHTHALLPGGERALDDLLPGFSCSLTRSRAVPLRAGLDVLVERPGFDPFPRRDLGWVSHGASRSLVESVLRRQLEHVRNVEWLLRCRVDALRVEAGRVRGVTFAPEGERSQSLEAALVVDASGRGALTLEALQAAGGRAPPESVIGVDFSYATAVFEIPPRVDADWLGVMHLPVAPGSARGAMLLPIEDGRWSVSTGGRAGEAAPRDPEGFMACLRTLRTPTLHQALREARWVGGISRFAYPDSVRRHFDRLAPFPGGLLPIGDAVCRVNPVYGQGMSVAAQQGLTLRGVLAETTADQLASGEMAMRFFQASAATIDTPWRMAALPDLVYPATRGERPPDFISALQFMQGLLHLAAQDAGVHKLMMEVQHLLKPLSALQDPDLVQRVMRCASARALA